MGITWAANGWGGSVHENNRGLEYGMFLRAPYTSQAQTRPYGSVGYDENYCTIENLLLQIYCCIYTDKIIICSKTILIGRGIV